MLKFTVTFVNTTCSQEVGLKVAFSSLTDDERFIPLSDAIGEKIVEMSKKTKKKIEVSVGSLNTISYNKHCVEEDE